MSLHDFSKDFITRCITEQNAYACLCDLCDTVGPRLSASHGEAHAVELFTDYLTGYGYESETQEFGYDAWRFGSSTVQVESGNQKRTIQSNPMGWSPGKTVSGPVIDAAYGGETDLKHVNLENSIALVANGAAPGQKGVHRSVKYRDAVDAGALGFLFYPDKPGGLVPMGSINLEAAVGEIPAAGISYEDAWALRRADNPHVELSTDCDVEPAISRNGMGVKSVTGSREIIVCGHIDTWNCPGAVDNGSGIASMMELARLLAPYEFSRTVRYVAFGSEELGLHGSKHYVDTARDLSQIVAVLNLDCVAIRDGVLGVATQDNEKFHRFWETVKKDLNIDFILSRESTMYSDHHPFCDKGVPAAALLSRGGGGFGFAHTAFDTLDKLDRNAFTLPLLITGVAIIELAMSKTEEYRV